MNPACTSGVAFPCLVPHCSMGLTNAALSLGKQVRLWHPEIFGCLRRPEDCSWLRNLRPSSVFPEIQAHCCFETPGLLQTINPVVFGVRLSSWMVSVSCPDGNTVIQACSWILCCTKSWNDKWSFQKQVQCKSRAATEHFVYTLFSCLTAHRGLWCFFFSSPIMCSEKMAYSEHLNW